MVNFESEVEFEVEFNPEEIASLVADTVLSMEKCPKECEVELLLTDEDTVHEINKEYRQIDSTTDVLSFPNIDWEKPSDFDGESFNDELLLDPDTGLLMLGQIVLCKERILSQAEEFGHEVKREYAFLIAHSMLHLLGYDHMEEDERALMEEKQRECMSILKIGR